MKNQELYLEKNPNQLLLDSSDDPYKTSGPAGISSSRKDFHKHGQDIAIKKLFFVCAICLIFMTIEVIGGYIANSIAIMSDAAHLLSDFLGFVISILSIYISRKSATSEMSYGFHRAEIIGALVSVTLIWGLTIWLLYEATMRIITPPKVDGFIMLIIAIIGFAFNLIMGIVLAYQGVGHSFHHHTHEHEHELVRNEPEHQEHEHHEHKHHEHNEENNPALKEGNLQVNIISNSNEHHDHEHEHDHHEHTNVNLRAALIHVIGDALQNVGVIVAGLIIFFFPYLSIVDPICTYIFSIIVGFTTIRILKDCIGVLMEGSPMEYDLETLECDLKNIQGVVDIHDLHVWSLSLGKISMTCHMSSECPQISLKKARRMLKKKYKITHSTLQVEDSNGKHAFHCGHDLHQ